MNYLDEPIAERILAHLATTVPYGPEMDPPPITWLPTARQTLWKVHDEILTLLRPFIYGFVRKGTAGPRPASEPGPAVRTDAIQKGLALLGAVAATLGTRQAVLSSHGGIVHDISFQPRPSGINWTAEHAIKFPDEAMITCPALMTLELADILFLTNKVLHAITHNKMGHIIDVVGTFVFSDQPIKVHVIVREVTSGRVYDAGLLYGNAVLPL